MPGSTSGAARGRTPRMSVSVESQIGAAGGREAIKPEDQGLVTDDGYRRRPSSPLGAALEG